jgi:hypothetical protein
MADSFVTFFRTLLALFYVIVIWLYVLYASV